MVKKGEEWKHDFEGWYGGFLVRGRKFCEEWRRWLEMAEGKEWEKKWGREKPVVRGVVQEAN